MEGKSTSQRFSRIEKRLSKIEKLLTNHLAHQRAEHSEYKSSMNWWVKVYLPFFTIVGPVIIAIISGYFK